MLILQKMEEKGYQLFELLFDAVLVVCFFVLGVEILINVLQGEGEARQKDV